MDFLPDEILLNIFEYLDGDSMIEASKVCQKWSFIITEMRSFKAFKAQFNLVIFLLRNSFGILPHPKGGEDGKIRIDGRVNNPPFYIPNEAFNLFPIRFEKIKKVHLKTLNLINTVEFLKLIKKTTEELTINSLLVGKNEDTYIDTKLKFPKLKKFISDEERIINVIKASPKLEVFKFSQPQRKQFRSHRFSEDGSETCVDFCMAWRESPMGVCNDTAKALKNLFRANKSLRELAFSNVSFNFNLDERLKLQKFELDLCYIEDGNLLKFLKTQKESLKELTITKMENIENSLNFILCEMNLRYFETDIWKLSTEVINITIRSFTSYYKFQRFFRRNEDETVRPYKISSMLTNLEDVTLYGYCDFYDHDSVTERLEDISNGHSYLEVLKLENLPRRALNFKNLKHLEVNSIESTNQYRDNEKIFSDNFEVLATIVKNAVDLKVLKVNNIKGPYKEEYLKNVIEASESLEEIYFGVEQIFSQDFLEFIKNNKKNLKEVSYIGNVELNQHLPDFLSYKLDKFFESFNNSQNESAKHDFGMIQKLSRDYNMVATYQDYQEENPMEAEKPKTFWERFKSIGK